MEKIIWVRSNGEMIGARHDDGLEVVNRHLQEGWKVKHISACAIGDSLSVGQAYVVIEKE